MDSGPARDPKGAFPRRWAAVSSGAVTVSALFSSSPPPLANARLPGARIRPRPRGPAGGLPLRPAGGAALPGPALPPLPPKALLPAGGNLPQGPRKPPAEQVKAPPHSSLTLKQRTGNPIYMLSIFKGGLDSLPSLSILCSIKPCRKQRGYQSRYHS